MKWIGTRRRCRGNVGAMIEMESNLGDALDGIDVFEARELPFALSRAMNATAFEVRRHIVETVWPRSVTLRNSRFAAAAIRVSKKADKRDLTVEIRDTLGRAAFSRQADGGVRSPVAGRHHLAVPQSSIRRNAGGSVPRGKRPNSLVGKSGVFKNRKGTAIMQRLRGGRVRVLYVLTPSARISKRFPAYAEAARVWDRVFPYAFDGAMVSALESSFRRLTMRRMR